MLGCKDFFTRVGKIPKHIKNAFMLRVLGFLQKVNQKFHETRKKIRENFHSHGVNFYEDLWDLFI
jgi:hypothetical protein